MINQNFQELDNSFFEDEYEDEYIETTVRRRKIKWKKIIFLSLGFIALSGAMTAGIYNHYQQNVYAKEVKQVKVAKSSVESQIEEVKEVHEKAIEEQKKEEEKKAAEEAAKKAEEERIAQEQAEKEAQQKAEEQAIQTQNNVASTSASWNGAVLTPSAGTIQGPSGKETYYNLDMSGVISIMRAMGNTDAYWVREDGVKMLGNYVMVAADLSIRPRGSLVETSLGTGIVCDTGGFIYSNPTQLDIATAW